MPLPDQTRSQSIPCTLLYKALEATDPTSNPGATFQQEQNPKSGSIIYCLFLFQLDSGSIQRIIYSCLWIISRAYCGTTSSRMKHCLGRFSWRPRNHSPLVLDMRQSDKHEPPIISYNTIALERYKRGIDPKSIVNQYQSARLPSTAYHA